MKTKFNVKDTVWTVRDCKAVCFEINVVIFEENIISYAVSRYGQAVPESQCFATKEELLEYIGDGN